MGYKGRSTLTLVLFFFGSPNPLTAECLPTEDQPIHSNPMALTSPAIIKELQLNLQEIDLFKGVVNGEVNEVFTSAIQQFQMQRHMPVDGEMTEPVRIMLQGRDNLQPNTHYTQAAIGQ